jgi:hypothetical protein
MLDGMMRLLPTAEVGFLGMVRNEETLEASTYAERLPEDLSGRQCYVLDPMLATGGTLAAAIRFLVDRGADHITAICLLAAPEGCDRLAKELDGLDVPVTVVTAAMDEQLNDKGYIVPGWATRVTGCTAWWADRPARTDTPLLLQRQGCAGFPGAPGNLAPASEVEDRHDPGGDEHQEDHDQDAEDGVVPALGGAVLVGLGGVVAVAVGAAVRVVVVCHGVVTSLVTAISRLPPALGVYRRGRFPCN